MDSSMNGHLPQERSGDEEVPLILLSSDLDRRQRAKALSQLSHQSQGSNVYDIGHDEVSVTMTTTSKQKKCTFLFYFRVHALKWEIR